jgi:hypothetical protein
MKIIFAILPLLLLNCTKALTSNNTNVESAYVVGVSFNSICCGPPPDDFLKTFVNKFKNANGVSVAADKIAGCGREGEFVVLFDLSKMKEPAKASFVAGLEKLIPSQDAENKRASTSSGGLALLYNVKASDYSHCRIKAEKWAY